MLAVGDVVVPEHRLRIATGYDDLYHLTPARVLHNALRLGYREVLNHYVGMSHYFRVDADGLVVDGLNGPCAAWHADFLARAKAMGFGAILSLSYELLDAHCPAEWKQRAADGEHALTGWEPPSALLSPANAAAMDWLQAVAQAFAELAVAAGQPVRFQVGEPWWWVMPDGRISFDAGPGVRSEADLQALIAFFRARRGAAIGFRLRDPFDDSSSAMTGAPGPEDQLLGEGDGARTAFPLIKDYDGQVRRITRPVAGSVLVSVDGEVLAEGWSLAARGVIEFEGAPVEGAEVRAGYRFDVPVRFAEDRLSLNRATFLAGEAPSVPLIEIRE